MDIEQMANEALLKIRLNVEYQTTFAQLEQLAEVEEARDRRDHQLALLALDIRMLHVVPGQEQARSLREIPCPAEIVEITSTRMTSRSSQRKDCYAGRT